LKETTRKITLLGSTGSIGTQTLEVVGGSGRALSIHALAAGTNVEKMEAQIAQFGPKRVAMADAAAAGELEARLSRLPQDLRPEVLRGERGIVELASDREADVVVNAVVGARGLLPTLAALDSGVILALANKESLVAGGELVMESARRGTLIPVDSEHSSIYRCIGRRDRGRIRSITITASGGAFRDWPLDRLAEARPEDALRHPVWNMGARVTIDSATMMNKALEIIEARHLFALEPSRIRVVVHPQAYVHGLVELSDGTLLAHLAPPDMRVPIAFALYYPEEPPLHEPTVDLAEAGALEFAEPDAERYPCLELGYRAAAAGGTSPAVLNAADEVAVSAFLEGRIAVTDIAEIARRVLDEHSPAGLESAEQALAADRWARKRASALIEAR